MKLSKKLKNPVLHIFSFLFLIIPLLSQDIPLDQQLFDQYERFKEMIINQRRFKHSDIQPLISSLEKDPQFTIKKIGQSIEGRAISLISIGSGKTHVLLWSQMHGDESTATMALLDIFNFFGQKNEYEVLKEFLKKELTLHFIPMLNPDGAEKFTRRNALDVDLNRDALRLQNPEAKILKKVRDSLSADWGFNLHDQSRYYAAGINPHTASISFLAPAYNYEKEVNEVRGNAMRLIGMMHTLLKKYIPGNVARYSDDFEPRAFGDNMQKWGTSTILIEAGGFKADREKQQLRKLHFMLLLSAFQAIADRSFENRGLEEYEQIPFNESNAFHDLILRKANIEKYGQTFLIDIAYRRHEIPYNQHQKYFFQSSISDIGDLSTSYAYEVLDVTNSSISPGKVFPKKIKNFNKLKKLNLLNLLAKGYTTVSMKKPPPKWQSHSMPIAISQYDVPVSNEIKIGQNPSLLLIKDGQIQMVVVNGFLFDLKKDRNKILQAME